MTASHTRPTAPGFPLVPSAEVQRLIRDGATVVASAPAWLLTEIDNATCACVAEVFSTLPALFELLRGATRSNLLHWAASNIREPGRPVVANLAPEILLLARDLERRGLSDAALDTFRTGQNVAWIQWMTLCFQLTQDVYLLRELLDVSARSIAAFVDVTVAAILERMAQEREQLRAGDEIERRQWLSGLLEGDEADAPVYACKLGYRLGHSQRAAVVWSREPGHEDALQRVTRALERLFGTSVALSVQATSTSIWLWLSSARTVPAETLERMLRGESSVLVALGSCGRGLDGFRGSHRNALTVQRWQCALGAGAPHVASFDEIRLVVLAASDVDQARTFVSDVLGDLAGADVELQSALRSYLRDGSNATKAALRERIHRNTLLRRLAAAEDLLPRPLDVARLEVAAALEILRWASF